MAPTTFYDYKIVVELLYYRLGAAHDAVLLATFKTDLGAPGQLENGLFYP